MLVGTAMRLLVFALGVLVATAAPARAAAIPLHWTEPISAYSRHLVLTVRVASLELGPGRWSAALSITNEGDNVIGLQNRFAVLAGPAEVGWPDVVLPARTTRPALPRTLGFHATWRGVVSGPGSPPRSSYLRLRLGRFELAVAPNLHLTVVSRHFCTW